MPATVQSRERPEKILVAMYRLSNGTTSLLKYEDIVVESFRLFPDEFALRGYPEFPDSSDIHKPLYGPLKRGGLIRSGSKRFGLTAKGVEVARSLVDAAGARIEEQRDPRRISRDIAAEVNRMHESAAAKLFADGKQDRILDTDLFSFLGCTVRTSRNDFLGRLRTTKEAINTSLELGYPTPESAELLRGVWTEMSIKFKHLLVREGQDFEWEIKR